MASRFTALLEDLRDALSDLADTFTTLTITLDMTAQSQITEGLVVLTAPEAQQMIASTEAGRRALLRARGVLVVLEEVEHGPRGHATQELIERLTQEIGHE